MILGTLPDFEIEVYLDEIMMAGSCGDYIVSASSIGGLGLSDPKIADLVPTDRHGAVAPPDYAQPRTLTIPLVWQRPTVREAMEALRALKVAWQPRPENVRLDIKMPGIGPADDLLIFFGRPRSTLDVDLSALAGGIINALATFVALDPIGYGGWEYVDEATGEFDVNNFGDAPSRRFIAIIEGDGGVPILTNLSDQGTDVRFSQALGVGETIIVDFLDRTAVYGGSGEDAYTNNVLAASTWPKLVPGINQFELTGADNVSIEYRPGWW